VADAGYCNVPQIERVLSEESDVLVSPVSAAKGIPAVAGQQRKPRAKRMEGGCLAMHEKLSTPEGSQLYARRKQLVEPVFAQTKVIRRADRFQRRGFAACRSEWRLIAATHNLLKALAVPARRRAEAKICCLKLPEQPGIKLSPGPALGSPTRNRVRLTHPDAPTA